MAFNRYDYANNNPVINRDPNGKDCALKEYLYLSADDEWQAVDLSSVNATPFSTRPIGLRKWTRPVRVTTSE
jgi:hypothetical protein